MIIRILFSVLAASLLSACSSGTTVVLIPDAGGKVGQVEVTTKGGSTVLTKANESAKAEKAEQAPSEAVQLSGEKVNDMFAETLAKEPMAPEHFRFYFVTGSANLLAEANAELAKAKTAIDVRKSCDLSVIGHSDRVGDNSTNKGISLQRADSVAKALTTLGVAGNCMDIRYYGENDPAIPTADNVDEPRNRRVEVEIR
ncbi:OmpA family protein [Methyloglobulus sp.]|uniref:OmpA family protein n=1 Tax=Methyloglobulus sp. TaxID=2518622 RepID=UPI0032B83A6D